MPRERKPVDEHKLQGTRPQYVNPEAIIPAGRPKYPRGISNDAKRVFKTIARLLEQRRSLSEGDGELMRLLAIAYDRHAKAVLKLAEEGEVRIYTRLDRKGNQVETEAVNLWLKIAQESEKFMVACYDRLGLSPLNRNKVKPAAEEKPAADPDTFPTREEATAPEQDVDLSTIDEGVIQ